MVAERPDLTLTIQHLKGAKIILEEAEGHMEHIMEMITATDIGTSTKHVLAYITSEGTVTVSDIVRRFGQRCDALEITTILHTLSSAERIEVEAAWGGAGFRGLVRGGRAHQGGAAATAAPIGATAARLTTMPRLEAEASAPGGSAPVASDVRVASA